MKIRVILCIIALLAIAGCTAKQLANFETATGIVCEQVRELEAAVALGTAHIEDESKAYALGLTYRQLIVQCDFRDEVFTE